MSRLAGAVQICAAGWGRPPRALGASLVFFECEFDKAEQLFIFSSTFGIMFTQVGITKPYETNNQQNTNNRRTETPRGGLAKCPVLGPLVQRPRARIAPKCWLSGIHRSSRLKAGRCFVFQFCFAELMGLAFFSKSLLFYFLKSLVYFKRVVFLFCLV